MEFNVIRADLVRELALLQGAAASQLTLPALSQVMIEARAGTIALTTTDLEVALTCHAPATVREPGSAMLPVRVLHAYAKLLPDAGISFKSEPNDWVTLISDRGHIRTRMAGLAREHWPQLPRRPEATLGEITAGDLGALISQAGFAVGEEDTRFIIAGALLILKPGSAALVATDGHRLAYMSRASTRCALEGQALLPRKTLRELQRLAGAAAPDLTVAIARDQNHIFFTLGDRHLVTREVAGKFADWERVLPKNFKRDLELHRQTFSDCIQRVAEFSDVQSHAIRLLIGPGEMRLRGAIQDVGEAEESMGIAYDGEDVEIAFNATYLMDFLKASEAEMVRLRLGDAFGPGELAIAGVDGYRYVVMPIKLDHVRGAAV